MIKIRLHGLPEEIEQAKTALLETFNVLTASEPYADKGNSQYYRCYLDCELKKESNTCDYANVTDKPKLLEKTTEELIACLEHCIQTNNSCNACPYSKSPVDCLSNVFGDVILKLKKLKKQRDILVEQCKIHIRAQFMAGEITDCKKCSQQKKCKIFRFCGTKEADCATFFMAKATHSLEEEGILKVKTKKERIEIRQVLTELVFDSEWREKDNEHN